MHSNVSKLDSELATFLESRSARHRSPSIAAICSQPVEVEFAEPGPLRTVNLAALGAAARQSGFRSIGAAMRGIMSAHESVEHVLAGRALGRIGRQLLCDALAAREDDLFPLVSVTP